VLSHELAHVRRGDWVTSLAAAINRAVFWYNPLAWWLERRLNELSEEACDANAIRSTGDAHRYANVVLDFAQLASRNPVLASTSMARASRAGRRIRGIIDGRIAPRRRMTRLAKAMMLALFLPAVYLAAGVQVASLPVPRISAREAHQAILSEGWHVTNEEALKLEAQLAADPENLAIRTRLLSYYSQYMISEPRTKHLMWLIEHHPEADLFTMNTVLTSAMVDWTGMNTGENAERARNLWMQHEERFPTNSRVLVNAALAVRGADSRISLELVKRARAVEPGNSEWTSWLGAIYARAVRESFARGRVQVLAAQSPDPNARLGFSLPLPESDALKNELETSRDAALIGATGEALVYETSRVRRDLFPDNEEVTASAAFGRQLLERARELGRD
jgi:hypothetical protein